MDAFADTKLERVLLSPCEPEPLPDLIARLELAAARGDATGVSAGRCLAVLDHLRPRNDGSYPVVSIADLVASACAPDMCKLQECALRRTGLPVVILRAPQRMQTSKVAAATFITLKSNPDAGFKLYESKRAALACAAAPPPPEHAAMMNILRAWRRGDPDAAVACLVAALGSAAAARYLHVSEDKVKARTGATLRGLRRYACVQADCLELECRLAGVTAGEAPGGARANRGRTNVDPRASAVALGGERPARRACAAPPQDDPAAVQ